MEQSQLLSGDVPSLSITGNGDCALTDHHACGDMSYTLGGSRKMIALNKTPNVPRLVDEYALDQGRTQPLQRRCINHGRWLRDSNDHDPPRVDWLTD